ncbi:altronate hydrolase (Altronic acid hydratase) [Peptoniphilus sp. ING2-D1G]|nr:altronate hydrolase (Altronic acid hydratase) [Peptoniphilus sp. ING2-D1G]
MRGYRRKDGSFGIRNHFLIIPTSICATHVAEKIAEKIPNAIALPNQHGCCQIGSDQEQTELTLAGFGLNPNTGAVLVVGLGCDGIQAKRLANTISSSGKITDYIIIQECGSTIESISIGVKKAERLYKSFYLQEQEIGCISDLVLGLECGGSDSTSGLASNPTIGYVSDKLIELGGSCILSETTEVIGAEHLLAKRFISIEEREKFLKFVEATEKRAFTMGEDLRTGQPTPGNKAGGLSTIEEKSLGCMYKAGTSPFVGALSYSESLSHKKHGLYFMDTPGQDINSITGMVAGGANIIIFSTGRGTPTGNPISPVIKITGNYKTYQNMCDNIDINASAIISGKCNIKQLGEKTFDFILQVANGKLTKSELLGHKEFGIQIQTPTF